MGRTATILLRLCVITSAIVMLLLSLRAVHAQTYSPPATRPSQPSADTPVYGYNPGQGLPRETEQLAPPNPYPVMPVQASPSLRYGENPQASQPAAYTAPQQPASQQPAPQQPYGFKPGDGGYGATQFGTQATDNYNPQAYYQDQTPVAPRVNADYRLGSGDKLRVTVYGEADLSGEYQVDGAGVVRLPLIGSLQAAGYTAPALEAWISSALTRGYLKNPRVNVEIITYRPFIIGAVARPGQYPYIDHISALNAVALAGGFTDTARQSTVYVRHESSAEEVEMPVDELSELRPGDTIRIKTTLFWQAMQIFTPLTPAIVAAATIR